MIRELLAPLAKWPEPRTHYYRCLGDSVLVLAIAAALLSLSGCKLPSFLNRQSAEDNSRQDEAADEMHWLSAESSGLQGSGSRTVSTGSPGEIQAAATAPHAGPLLEVHGVQPDSGPLRVAVFSDANSFPQQQQATWRSQFPSQAESVTTPLNVSSEKSSFAVAVFQDLNNDGILNRSPIGIPSEPYGFSGNAAGAFGPPTFEQAAVSASGNSPVQVSLR